MVVLVNHGVGVGAIWCFLIGLIELSAFFRVEWCIACINWIILKLDTKMEHRQFHAMEHKFSKLNNFLTLQKIFPKF